MTRTDTVASGQDAAGLDDALVMAVQYCHDGLIVVDASGQIRLCNPRALALLRRSDDQPGAGPLLHDIIAGPLAHLAGTAMPANENPQWDVAFPDGTVIELSLDGTAAWGVITCRDVTLTRQLRAQLAACETEFGALEERFNGVIGSVMREVTDRQNQANELAKAKATAEAATEAKSVFLASMSHEVRTPLNGILGFTELLLDNAELDVVSRQTTEKIRSAGTALLNVVNDILDFSEIESCGIVLDQRDFSLAGLIASAAAIVEPQLLKKGLQFKVDIAPAISPRLQGDENRLRQILLNLLNNAVKFTDHGSVAISVICVDHSGNRQRLRFDVTDTGTGIPLDKHDRLFERFSQIDTSIRCKFGGTGLGLAIAKQLVEVMGGYIAVDSAEGRGSVFSFTLDLAVAQTFTVAQAPPSIKAAINKRVLLVDDVEINREIAQAMIESAGYAVDLASSGSAAVAAVKDRHYDLILMDVQMPDMDGITATRFIRTLHHGGHTPPIVAMTAHVLPRDVEHCLAAGMNDHIGKPFKKETLHRKIAEWCNG